MYSQRVLLLFLVGICVLIQHVFEVDSFARISQNELRKSQGLNNFMVMTMYNYGTWFNENNTVPTNPNPQPQHIRVRNTLMDIDLQIWNYSVSDISDETQYATSQGNLLSGDIYGSFTRQRITFSGEYHADGMVLGNIVVSDGGKWRFVFGSIYQDMRVRFEITSEAYIRIISNDMIDFYLDYPLESQREGFLDGGAGGFEKEVRDAIWTQLGSFCRKRQYFPVFDSFSPYVKQILEETPLSEILSSTFIPPNPTTDWTETTRDGSTDSWTETTEDRTTDGWTDATDDVTTDSWTETTEEGTTESWTDTTQQRTTNSWTETTKDGTTGSFDPTYSTTLFPGTSQSDTDPPCLPETSTPESTSSPKTSTSDNISSPESSSSDNISSPESSTSENISSPESSTSENISSPESSTSDNSWSTETSTSYNTWGPETTTSDNPLITRTTTGEYTSTPRSQPTSNFDPTSTTWWPKTSTSIPCEPCDKQSILNLCGYRQEVILNEMEAEVLLEHLKHLDFGLEPKGNVSWTLSIKYYEQGMSKS